MTTCDIQFDQLNGVYYSGQVLNGKVSLSTNKSKSVRLRWEVRRTRRSHNNKSEHYTEVFSAHVTYLASRTYVAGENRGQTFELPAGLHEYTFSCQLPPGLPTSFSGTYGEVKYDVEVTIDRPLRFDNVFKQKFSVIQPLDLNYDPNYLNPREGNVEKYFCCWCCADGPVKSHFAIPFAGYAPGQKIKYNLLVDNEAGKDVKECKIKLVQVVHFHSHTPRHETKTVTNDISKEKLRGVLRLSKRLLTGELEVPALAPTTTTGIIQINYYLKAEIDCGSFHTNDEILLPFVIGTVPLITSATNPQNVITVQPTAPSDTPDENGDKPPSYNSIVPPSFEDALGINGKFVDHDDMGSKHQEGPFVPKYPVYYNFALPSAPELSVQNSETDALNASSSHYSSAQPTTSIGWSVPGTASKY